jgi:hypothetical protein
VIDKSVESAFNRVFNYFAVAPDYVGIFGCCDDEPSSNSFEKVTDIAEHIPDYVRAIPTWN